ncbi:MAG: sugar ABC transporter substrate-binding protein [Solirubrobacteraceae bacterium]
MRRQMKAGRRRTGRLLAVVALAGLAAVGGGCGSSGGDSTSAAVNPSGATATTAGGGGQAAKVAYISYSDNDFIQAELSGVKRAVAAHGGSATIFNAGFDPQKQVQQCQDAIQSGRYNAIVLAPVAPATGIPCVTAAKAANIPVVNLEGVVGQDPNDLEPQVDGVVGSVLLAPIPNAAALTELTRRACEGLDPCKVIVEVATPSDYFTNQVPKMVKEKLPNVEIVQKLAGMYDPSVIAKAFPDALSAHPDADVFLSASDSQALAVVPALKQAGKLGQIALIGNGGSRLGAKAVADGTMFGTAANYPEQMGAAAGKMANQAVNGEPVEPNSVDAMKIDTPLYITKETVKDFTPEWGAERPE